MEKIDDKIIKIDEVLQKVKQQEIDLGNCIKEYENLKISWLFNDPEKNEYIDEIQKMEKKAEKYNYLLNVLSVFTKIYKEVEIKREMASNIAQQIIDNFSSIINLDSNQDDIEKQLLNKIYKIIYDIMKLEIMSVNETNLFNYFADKDLSRQFINDFMKEDLIHIKERFNKIKEEEDDNEYFLKLLAININNLDDCYNLENLKLILRYGISDFLYKIDVKRNLKNLLERHEDITSRIISRQNYIKDIKVDLESLKIDLIKNKKNIRIRVGSIILSLGIVTGIFALNSGKLKRACTDKIYKGIETSYSSDYGIKEKGVELDVSSNPTDSVKINVYSKVFDNQRTISTYDVSSIKLTDIKDYLDINLDDISYDISLISYDDGTSSSEYNEVVITEINDSEVFNRFNASDYYLVILLCSLLIEVFYDFLAIVFKDYFKDKIFPGVIYNILRIYAKEQFNPSLYSQYKKNINEIKDIINNIEKLKHEIDTLEIHDKEVKEEFNKLYQQYSYLLTEAKLILTDFESVEKRYDSKKLVRRKDN